MKLSEIKDLLEAPTQTKAENLVRAVALADYSRFLSSTPAEASQRFLPSAYTLAARQRVTRFLYRVGGIRSHLSNWSTQIVIDDPDQCLLTASGHWIAPEEYEDEGFTCERCEGIFHVDEQASTLDDVELHCDGCASRHLYYCTCQGAFGEYPCDECDSYRGSRGTNHGFVNYTTNVVAVLRSFRHAPGELLPPEPLYLGVELEVVPRGSALRSKRVVYDAVRDFAVLKYDSSVPEGFEIVSIPATLAWHREVWPAALEKVRKVARSWSDPTCGMHVHFSRSALTPLQIGKVLVFINHPDNQHFVWRLAGRSSNDYARVIERKVTDGKLQFLSEHHDAISLSHRNASNTLEVRIFRGNVSEYGFLKNLDFVAALAEWTAKASINHLTATDFVSWMQQPWNRKSYPYLDGWLTQTGYYRVSSHPAQNVFED